MSLEAHHISITCSHRRTSHRMLLTPYQDSPITDMAHRTASQMFRPLLKPAHFGIGRQSSHCQSIFECGVKSFLYRLIDMISHPPYLSHPNLPFSSLSNDRLSCSAATWVRSDFFLSSAALSLSSTVKRRSSSSAALSLYAFWICKSMISRSTRSRWSSITSSISLNRSSNGFQNRLPICSLTLNRVSLPLQGVQWCSDLTAIRLEKYEYKFRKKPE